MLRKLLSKWYFCAVALIISGAVSAAALVQTELGVVQWISLIPTGLVLLSISADRTVRLRRVYLFGWLFFASYFLVIYSWILSMYPLDFTGISRPLAATFVFGAWIGLSAFFSALFALAFVFVAMLSRARLGSEHKLIAPLAFALLWVAFEWGQTLHWSGVPWGRLCLGQVDVPYMLNGSAILGSYFVTFSIVFVNATVAQIILRTDGRRLSAITAAFVFTLNLTLGIISCALSDGALDKASQKINVAVIQANISTVEKWASGNELTNTIERYDRLTMEAAQKGADIVIWSETALPVSLYDYPTVGFQMSRIAQKYGVTLVTGIFTDVYTEDAPPIYYNSVIAYDKNGALCDQVYHKRHLVPFGEFIPYRDLMLKVFPFLGEIEMLGYDLTPGDSSTVLSVDGLNIGAIICFDSIYEDATLDAATGGAQFIAMATNESWFDSSYALKMLNDQARLRAIECGRYIARSANTGISSIVSPNGEVVCELEKLTEGDCIAELSLIDPKDSYNTPYSLVGNLFVYLSLAVLVALFLHGCLTETTIFKRISIKHEHNKKRNTDT